MSVYPFICSLSQFVLTILTRCILVSFVVPLYASAASLSDTVEKIKPSIVGIGSVQLTRSPSSILFGTGFVVGNGKYVITNAHVASRSLNEKKNEFLVVFIGTGANPERRKANKFAEDKEHDLTLLEISGPPLPALSIGNSADVKEGDLYAFTGFPIGAVLGLYPVTHRGIISSITPIVTPANTGRQLTAKQIKRLRTPYKVFQLDATAYPGNSGSPLYSPETGKVVGVVNMVFVKSTKESSLSKPSGISYAIPAIYTQELIDSVKNR